MGLTVQSTGTKALERKQNSKGTAGMKTVALAGNPNVGKSTVFNSLTGLKQHTGNWPGKTVTNAKGRCRHKGRDFLLVDLPGTYSLMASSVEEEVARDFICFTDPDAVVIVADATCLERNLNLVLQTLEITRKAVVCVNLIDEAKKKGIRIDIKKLSARLGVPVVAAAARSGKGMDALMDAVYDVSRADYAAPFKIEYGDIVERAIAAVEPYVKELTGERLSSRWAALKLLDADKTLTASLKEYLGFDPLASEDVMKALDEARAMLREAGIGADELRDETVSCIVKAAEEICSEAVRFEKEGYNRTDRRIDKVLTSRVFGLPIMLALLGVVFWLTITGANLPSQLLSDGLFWVEEQLLELFVSLGAPDWLRGILVLGMFRTLAWVVSVMLPPMAIFFPLFTLLEDLGYLPRVAFNLDKFFKKACACGKQALTMCMGFGCNAAGVTGCRIIDSPRERLIATVTNSFVPCNGRFPPPSQLQKTISRG